MSAARPAPGHVQHRHSGTSCSYRSVAKASQRCDDSRYRCDCGRDVRVGLRTCDADCSCRTRVIVGVHYAKHEPGFCRRECRDLPPGADPLPGVPTTTTWRL